MQGVFLASSFLYSLNMNKAWYIYTFKHLSFPALLHLKVTRTRRRKLKEINRGRKQPQSSFYTSSTRLLENDKNKRQKYLKKLSTSYDWNATGSRVIKMSHRCIAENAPPCTSYVFSCVCVWNSRFFFSLLAFESYMIFFSDHMNGEFNVVRWICLWLTMIDASNKE